jgi:hypothetical protein
VRTAVLHEIDSMAVESRCPTNPGRTLGRGPSSVQAGGNEVELQCTASPTRLHPDAGDTSVISSTRDSVDVRCNEATVENREMDRGHREASDDRSHSSSTLVVANLDVAHPDPVGGSLVGASLLVNRPPAVGTPRSAMNG